MTASTVGKWALVELPQYLYPVFLKCYHVRCYSSSGSFLFSHVKRGIGQLLAKERCWLLSVTYFGITEVVLLKAGKTASNHAIELSHRTWKNLSLCAHKELTELLRTYRRPYTWTFLQHFGLKLITVWDALYEHWKLGVLSPLWLLCILTFLQRVW